MWCLIVSIPDLCPLSYFYVVISDLTPLWIIHVISVLCLLCFCARLFIDALWKGLTSWLSLVMSNHEFVKSGVVLDCIDS